MGTPLKATVPSGTAYDPLDRQLAEDCKFLVSLKGSKLPLVKDIAGALDEPSGDPVEAAFVKVCEYLLNDFKNQARLFMPEASPAQDLFGVAPNANSKEVLAMVIWVFDLAESLVSFETAAQYGWTETTPFEPESWRQTLAKAVPDQIANALGLIRNKEGSEAYAAAVQKVLPYIGRAL